MDYRVAQLIDHMVKDDECDEYVTYVPKQQQDILAVTPPEDVRVVQVEVYKEDNSFAIITVHGERVDVIDIQPNTRFEIYKHPLIIGG